MKLLHRTIIIFITIFIYTACSEQTHHNEGDTSEQNKEQIEEDLNLTELHQVVDSPNDNNQETPQWNAINSVSENVTSDKTESHLLKSPIIIEHHDNTLSPTIAELEERPMPTVIPVLSRKEADALVEYMRQEEASAKNRGNIFFQERFRAVQICADRKNDPHYKNIQETPNWIIFPKDMPDDDYPIARVQKGLFTIQSNIPLEYSFINPLSEHKMYYYTLCVSAKGNGTVVLKEKNSYFEKSFNINSNSFQTFTLSLGEAKTFNQMIMPTISFVGDLQIESITIFQKKENNQKTIALGVIEAISNVPDIKKANYPDCFYTARFVVKEIIDGAPVPETLQLLIPAFRNNVVDPLSQIMKTGNWKVAIMPFSMASNDEQEIEQVDELESYEYTPYILEDATISVVHDLYTSAVPILEGQEYVSPYDNPVNTPIEEQYKNDSQKAIEEELNKINSIISTVIDEDSINNAFQLSWNETQKKYQQWSADSSLLWAKEKNSFFALPQQWQFIHTRKITEPNLKALVELNRFFQSQGLVFILQVVPNLYDIAALVLNPDFQKYGDQQSAVVVKQLLENGIEAQYISDEIVKHAFDYERLFVYPTDFHPEGASDIMTSVLAKRLLLFDEILPKQLSPEYFSKKMEDSGKKWPYNSLLDIGNHEHGSFVQTPHLYYDGKLIYPSDNSPILIIGNSFLDSPQAKGSGFISLLASKIYCICSAKQMGGVSALTGIPQLLLTEYKKYLSGKKIAILPISIEFLSGEYCLTNVNLLDKKKLETSKSSVVLSCPCIDYTDSVFPTSIVFNYKSIRDYCFYRTGFTTLSKEQHKLSIPIPDGLSPRRARISLQPLYMHSYTGTASIKINNSFSHKLASYYGEPNWEILDCDISNNTKDINIAIDLEDSTGDAIILISNVSFY